MINVQNPRDRSAACAKSDVCGVNGWEMWGQQRRLADLLPPGFGVPPPPPEASFPGWAKAPERQDPFVLSLEPIISQFTSSFPGPPPHPFVPPSVPQPRSLPPGRVSHKLQIVSFQKAEASGCHGHSNAQPSPPGTPASLDACALMLCWERAFLSASLRWPGQ